VNDINRQLKVLFLASDQSGPSFHVQWLPLQYFHKYNLLKGRIEYTLEKAIASSEADIVMWQRQYLPESLMLTRALKQKGIIVGSNIDDNVWKLPDGNPAKQIYQGETLARYEQILREVDFLTTSTPYLKKLALKFNPNVYVERNLVEPHYNEFVAPGRDKGQEDTIRIGWHLTVHHSSDAEIIKDVISAITQKYSQVRWIMMGWLPPSVAKLPKNKWEYFDFVPVDAFYPALASLDFDIGIAPLQDNPFNWGKTHRKFSEYAILGIPCILSPILPYLGLDKEEVAILPEKNSTENWVKALSFLIEHQEEREAQARRAYYWVLQNQDINLNIAEHAAIFYDAFNKFKDTDLKVPGYENTIWNFKEAERIQNLKIIKGINDV